MLSVSVDHGVVEAQAPGSTIAAGTKLTAGEGVTIDSVTHAIERGSREASQIAPWRDNLVVAEKEAVSALVAAHRPLDSGTDRDGRSLYRLSAGQRHF